MHHTLRSSDLCQEITFNSRLWQISTILVCYLKIMHDNVFSVYNDNKQWKLKNRSTEKPTPVLTFQYRTNQLLTKLLWMQQYHVTAFSSWNIQHIMKLYNVTTQYAPTQARAQMICPTLRHGELPAKSVVHCSPLTENDMHHSRPYNYTRSQ